MPRTARALVQSGPSRLELTEFPIPTIGADDGLMRIDRCGLCGTDVEQVHGELSFVPDRAIPGHEPVGTVEAIGEQAAERWGVAVGDRIVVEAMLPCRACGECAQGRFNTCIASRQLGFVPVTEAPSLYGGFAEYMYLPRNANLHRVPSEVGLDIAPFYNALACGVEWVSELGNVRLGDTVVVLGCGQRGLAAAIVAKAVGAANVIVTGLTRDAAKLTIARDMGIDATIDVETEDVRVRVRELTGGGLADTVIDVVPSTPSTIVDAIDIAKMRGTIVIAGVKGGRAVPDLQSDQIVLKALTLRGARGKRSQNYPIALSMLADGRIPFERLAPRTYPLDRALDAIEDMAGLGPGTGGVCVSIDPTR
jgi:threonine dehydrogenase-like Zn-dependent dehydrogenase